MKFNLIMVCPPWKRFNRYHNQGPCLADNLPLKLNRAIEAYEFIQDILRSFTTDNHIVAVWVPVHHVAACKEYMERMDYTIRGSFVWLRPNLKRFSERNNLEFLLVYDKGGMRQPSDRFLQMVDSHFPGTVKKLSEKPESAYRFLEEEFRLANKLQIYGWTKRPGWTLFHKNL